MKKLFQNNIKIGGFRMNTKTNLQNDQHTNIRIVLEKLLSMGLISESEYVKSSKAVVH